MKCALPHVSLLPQCEDPSEVDVAVGQVPPPNGKGELTEQETDVPIPALVGGGGIAKSRLCSLASTPLSTPDVNLSDL